MTRPFIKVYALDGRRVQIKIVDGHGYKHAEYTTTIGGALLQAGAIVIAAAFSLVGWRA